MKLEIYASCLIVTLTLSSCESFLETELPKSKVAKGLVFSTDATATSALTGIYVDMVSSQTNFASGSYQGAAALSSLSSDEMINYAQKAEFIEFQGNILTAENQSLLNLWSSAYSCIYQANAVLEGLSSASKVTTATKLQLQGESLFIRAFCHFYLINLFGEVPLITSTDFRVNSVTGRASTSDIYSQIKEDLIQSQQLLSDEYIKNDRTSQTERVRPNKATATALLSRVYLYLEEWANAEEQASSIINNTAMYSLPEIGSTFLKDSPEAIWQLRPVVPNLNTQEAYSFIVSGTPQFHILSSHLLNAFEPGDNRLSSWVGSFDTGVEVVYFAFKYKVRQAPELSEFSTVFRLAEQHLIRAEARAQLDKLAAAIDDIDVIRSRAGLPRIQDTNPNITKADLLITIEHERQVELFTEWGHRWFDLKRTNRANTILSPIKPEWNKEDVLYPIPQAEINRNIALKSQNPGY